MELDEMKTIWTQHEQRLIENTRLNKELLRKLLLTNNEKRIDWIKIKMLASLILIPIGIAVIAVPRIEFSLKFEVILGIILFASIAIVTYIWMIKLYLLFEKVNFNEPVLKVRKHLKMAEKYKIKTRRNGYILAPFMVIGVFLSCGMSFLSPKMIPFYILCIIVFIVSLYIQSKYGLMARIRKIDLDLKEISNLE